MTNEMPNITPGKYLELTSRSTMKWTLAVLGDLYAHQLQRLPADPETIGHLLDEIERTGTGVYRVIDDDERELCGPEFERLHALFEQRGPTCLSKSATNTGDHS